MKPLFVLVLVLVAVGVLFFAISGLDGGGSSGTIAPAPPDAAGPVARPSGAETPTFDPGDPGRREVAPVESSQEERQAQTQGEAYANRLVGLVEDETGQPVAEAKVTLTRAGGMSMMFVNSDVDRSGDRYARTASDGSFAFVNVEPYAHYALEVDHADFSRATVDEVDVPLEGERREPTIVLRSGAQLTGFIRDTTGAGIAGAVVHLDRMFFPAQGEPSPDSQSATADELGRYVIKNIPPGNRAMRVEADGFANAVVNGLSFQEVDKIERDVTLDIAEMICGIVVGPGNAPVAGAQVIAISFSNSNTQCMERTDTGEDGRFCLEKLAPGKYTVGVQAEGYRAGRANRAETGESDVVIEMQPQAIVRGKVVDAESGAPLSSFTVTLRTTFEGHDQTAKTETSESFQNTGGEFELIGVDQGSFVVEADAPGYAPTFSEPFRVTQGQLTAGILVRINRGGAISGTVVDADGNPVARALVETFGNDWTGSEFDRALGDMLPGNATRRQGRTDANGNFAISALTPETYQLRIQAADHCEHIQTDLKVLSGQNSKLGQVELIRGGTISGMVLDQAGTPVEGSNVMLRVSGRTNQAPRYYQTKSGRDGRYALRNVFPGNYRVMAAPPQGRGGNIDFLGELSGSRSSEQPVAVSDGSSHTIELRLGG